MSFVKDRLELNRRISTAALRPANDNAPSGSPEEVLARRAGVEAIVAPSEGFAALRFQIQKRQAVGDAPKPANDEKPKSEPRVRKSSGKFVRGSFADALPMVMYLRNMTDHTPEPIVSNWSTDASATIPEMEETNDAAAPSVPFDMLIEIEPSISKIRREIEKGEVERGAPRPPIKKGRRQPGFGPITRIGKLKFSDGKTRERAMRIREGKVEAYQRVMPSGAMLQTAEKPSPHIGTDPGVGMSNSRLVGMLLPRAEDGSLAKGRPFTPKGKTQRGRSLNRQQSQALIDGAIANTPVLPPVTICPPGVASGTSRYSDQFVGVVKAAKGKGGAVQWVDVFTSVRNHQDRMAALAELDPEDRAILYSALNARSFGDLDFTHCTQDTRRGQRRLVAANDNFSAIVARRAA